jgi:hypothetical protein
MEVPDKMVAALAEVLQANAAFYRLHAVRTLDMRHGELSRKLSKKLQNLRKDALRNQGGSAETHQEEGRIQESH